MGGCLHTNLGSPFAELLGCKHPSSCGGLAGHGRDFRELQAGDKHGCRRYSAPAEQFPASANEFGLRAQREIEDHLGRATVELLWQLEERLFRPGLPVGRTPDRQIERFLFNLIRDGEAAEKSARGACGDVKRGAVAISFKSSIRGNEIQFTW